MVPSFIEIQDRGTGVKRRQERKEQLITVHILKMIDNSFQ